MDSVITNRPSREEVSDFTGRIDRSRVPAWKRALDCTLTLVIMPLWLPLGMLIALFVKVVSPGSALFRQERIGHLGARFHCLKFRTMMVNADSTAHREHLNHLMASNLPMKKLDDTGDSRLIPGGLWLRALGLDELPQLINVLRGEMSLVGPRPSTAYEYEMFQPRHRQRCETLPGLTGLWQVSGKNKTTFEEMIRLDCQYARSRTLAQDLAIISRTIPAIISQMLETRKSGGSLLRKVQLNSIVLPSVVNVQVHCPKPVQPFLSKHHELR